MIHAVRPSIHRESSRTWRGALTAALLCAPFLLTSPAATAQDNGLEQRVEADEEIVQGEVVLDSGHVDLGPRFIDGEWTLLARDDREMPPVWRSPGDVVFHVGDEALLETPDNPDFEFLGVPAGNEVHVIAQTQVPEVVWLGWNTQDPEVVERLSLGADLTLHEVQGPGHVFLFLQEGISGPPNLLWRSDESASQKLWMESNTHTHANWVFTEPGNYSALVEVHAELSDGTVVSDTATLRFAVGEESDSDALFAEAPLEAGPAGAPVDAAETDNVEGAEGSTLQVVLLVLAGVAVVAIGGVLIGVASNRRRRAAARATLGENETGLGS